MLRRWAGRKSLCWGEGCVEGKDVLRRWAGRKSLCWGEGCVGGRMC